MFIVGLSGGIGSGKSVVSGFFSEYGITIVDADVIARDSVKPGSQCLNQIIEHFGNKILLETGELDRRQLRKIIFTSATDKMWLESVTHPVVREKILIEIDCATSEYCILSSPILLETTLYQLVHRILIVDLEESLQIERAASRDNSNIEEIKKIISSQISRKKRLQRADDIIDNSKDLDFTISQVATLHSQYLQMARSRAQ